MPEYRWPDRNERQVLGKRVSRLDGPDKVTGKAKYTSDVNLAGTLHAKFLRCPHAHARVTSIDTSAAESVPGVKAVRVIQGPGKEVQWSLDDIAVVAAVDEATAEDAVRRIAVEYEVLPHLVNEDDLGKAGDRTKPASEQVKGDPDQAFQDADAVVEGEYGIPVITHCCLEPHGQVIDWSGDTLTAYQSTQNISGMANQFAQPLEIPAANVSIVQDHVGGGYGSKFGADSWGLETARLSRGNRPSGPQLSGAGRRAVRGRGPPLRLRQDQGGSQERRHPDRLGSGILGHQRLERRGDLHAGPSLRDQSAQRPQEAHRNRDQHRSGAGLEGAQPSSDLLADLRCPG